MLSGPYGATGLPAEGCSWGGGASEQAERVGKG